MKSGRQNKIIELIKQHDIETQEELAERLNAAGYQVTQATVSRDIRELKLTKISSEAGKQKYAVISGKEKDTREKYIRVLCDGLISMDKAMNILVVKTVPGMAMAVAAAIDSIHLEGVAGCIAGDDTIMCAIKSAEKTDSVMEKLAGLIRKGNK